MSTQIVIPSNPRMGSTSAKPPTTRASSVPPQVAPKPRLRWRPPQRPQIQVDKTELKKKLTPIQYKVTQEKHTERAFSGEYLKLNERGLYCCVVCDEELFSSETKFNSGCGWPAFYDAIDKDKFILQADLSHVGGNLLLLALNQDLARTEVTCAKCGAHLGHLFDDGPKDKTGQRYCVNSASLKFIKPNDSRNCDSTTAIRPEVKQCSLGTPDVRTFNLLKPVDANRIVVHKPEASNTPAAVVTKPDKTEKIENKLVKPVEKIENKVLKTVEKIEKNEIKPLKPTEEIEEKFPKPLSAASFCSDFNNNRTINNSRYSSVKSRYLNHLDTMQRQSVVRNIIAKFDNGGKTLLETHL